MRKSVHFIWFHLFLNLFHIFLKMWQTFLFFCTSLPLGSFGKPASRFTIHDTLYPNQYFSCFLAGHIFVIINFTDDGLLKHPAIPTTTIESNLHCSLIIFSNRPHPNNNNNNNKHWINNDRTQYEFRTPKKTKQIEIHISVYGFE